MKKDDIQRSYHRDHSGLPMLNVKLYDVSMDRIVAEAEGLDGAPPLFIQWIRNELTEANVEAASDAVREWQWEDAEDLAKETFGDHVKVWSAGRCGGWLVVDGLPDVDEWDAIAVSKWSRFAKRIEAIRSDHCYQVADFLWVNTWPDPEVHAIG